MPQLWKYLTELNETEEAHEESDKVVINQGGHSVQISWSKLKESIETKLVEINDQLESVAFVGDDEEEGYIDAEVTLDNMKQDIVSLRETLTGVTNALTETNALIEAQQRQIDEQKNNINGLGNKLTKLMHIVADMPTINYGEQNPNSLIDSLQPKDGDVYIYTGELSE